MRKRDAVREIEKARELVEKEIRARAAQGGMYARGLSSEGYAGGYRDALDDVMLLLRDVMPNRYPYWNR